MPLAQSFEKEDKRKLREGQHAGACVALRPISGTALSQWICIQRRSTRSALRLIWLRSLGRGELGGIAHVERYSYMSSAGARSQSGCAAIHVKVSTAARFGENACLLKSSCITRHLLGSASDFTGFFATSGEPAFSLLIARTDRPREAMNDLFQDPGSSRRCSRERILHSIPVSRC